MTAADQPKRWVCACVKRDKAGNIAAIKMHHPARQKCRQCGATRPTAPNQEKQ
jgi:hypothetical protein